MNDRCQPVVGQFMALLLSVCLGACATPYQARGFAGGFSETRLGEHRTRVTFKGNGYTSHERCSDFGLLRCAEIALDHGCNWIRVVDEREETDVRTISTPSTSYTSGTVSTYGNYARLNATTTTYGGQNQQIASPRNVVMVDCYPSRPIGAADAYDVVFLTKSICDKYGIQPKGNVKLERGQIDLDGQVD